MQEGIASKLLEDYKSNIKRIVRLSIMIDNYSIGTFDEHRLSTMGQLHKIQELFLKQRKYISKAKLVRETLEKLPETERKCLIHFYVRGNKGKDIDKSFDFTERTFYRYKAKALKDFEGMLLCDKRLCEIA